MITGIARWLGENVDGLDWVEVGGGNVFEDFAPSEPDRLVTVYTAAGPEPDSKLPYDPAEFQVVARSEDGGAWAWDTIREIYSKLHGLRYVELPDGTYLNYCISMQGSPILLGDDDNGRQQYSIDFRTEVINRTEERP